MAQLEKIAAIVTNPQQAMTRIASSDPTAEVNPLAPVVRESLSVFIVLSAQMIRIDRQKAIKAKGKSKAMEKAASNKKAAAVKKRTALPSIPSAAPQVPLIYRTIPTPSLAPIEESIQVPVRNLCLSKQLCLIHLVPEAAEYSCCIASISTFLAR